MLTAAEMNPIQDGLLADRMAEIFRNADPVFTRAGPRSCS